MVPILAFDIETVPDVAGIRLLHELPADLPDRDVAELAFQKRRVQTGNDFLPPHLQRVIVISCVARDEEGVKIFSIAEPERDEKAIIQRFFDAVQRNVPQLVSWNGKGFDIPVLNHRALIHGVCCTKFWENGDDDQSFRYNNYTNRYQTRHLDLMDQLAMFNSRNFAPLDDMARLTKLPGKQGMGGAEVWPEYQNGNLKAIRDYCEADVVNTFLLFLKFQVVRGVVAPEQYEAECAALRSTLEKRAEPHWKEFLSLWKT
jgi:predicted PolB exonuclease-like 3'-5' exonuclease